VRGKKSAGDLDAVLPECVREAAFWRREMVIEREEFFL